MRVVAIGLPAGTTFQLLAEATFSDVEGNLYSADPAWATLTVEQVAGVSIERTGRLRQAAPGQDSYIPLRIVNVGNGLDAFTLSVSSSKKWSVAMVYDDNGDGVHQSDEQSVITTAGLMVADGYSPCFARVTVPQDAASGDTVTVTAVSNYDAGGSNQAEFTVDPEGSPTVVITAPTSDPTCTVTSPSLDIGGTASGGLAIAKVEWATGRGTSGTCSGTSSWTATGIALSAGRNVITVTASDAAGNKGTCMLTVTYSQDAVTLTIEIDTPTNQGRCARNCPVVTIGGIATDDSAVTGVTWSNAATGETGACVLNGAAWSAAGIGLAAGDNAITATAADDSGNTATAVVTVTYVDAVPGAAWTGLAMVSLPIIPDEIDPELETGFSGDYWCTFLPDVNSYAVYPEGSTWLDPPESTPGRGFWACFDPQAATPYGTIPAQDQPATIHLTTGWNLVGTPFLSEVKWDISKLTVSGPDGSARALSSASDLTLGYAWGWRQDPNDPRTGSYYLVYDSSIVPGVDDKLAPWRAYWIKANRDCDLIVPAP